MDATPQMKELRREGIDPDSARGVILRTRAQTAVKRACQLARQRLGHCSMWKEIRRRDGRPIPDRTQEALEEIGKPPAPQPPDEVARGGRGPESRMGCLQPGSIAALRSSSSAGQSSSSAGTSW